MVDAPEKKKIKLIYKGLQGYLSQLPLPKNTNDICYDKPQWEFLNNTIDRLYAINGESYDEFRIT